MKLYHSAMEHCVPPEGLEERLRQRVLSAAPQTQRKHVFCPRGYVRKAVLAAVLAIILTVSAGAAVLGQGVLPAVRRGGRPDPHGAGGAAGRLCLQRLR